MFPFGFQAAGDEPVVGVDGPVAALGPGGVVAGLLDLAAVLGQGGVVAVFELPGGLQACIQRGGGQRGQERAGDGGVDGLPADAHVPGAAAVDQLGGTLAVVVRHAFRRAGVEDGELAAAGPAGGQALQQRAAFPDRAGARLAGLRPDVGADAGLVALVGVPVGEPGVVIGDEDLPLVSGQPAGTLAQRAAGVKVAFLAGAAVDVRAGIRGVGQRGVHRVVGRFHPGDFRDPAAAPGIGDLLQRPAQPLGA